MKILQITGICTALLLFTVAPVLKAQTIPNEPEQYRSTQDTDNYSEETISKFSEVMKSVEKVKIEAQKEMDEVIADQGFTRSSYSNLADRVKNSTPDDRPNEEELRKFALINEQMMDMQMKIQPELKRIVEEAGMQMDEYEEQMNAYQEDEVFRKKVKAKM